MLQSNARFKWFDYVRSIFDQTGNTDILLNQNVITSRNLHLIIKQTLNDQFLTKWRSKLQLSNKGKQYSLFKDDVNLRALFNQNRFT